MCVKNPLIKPFLETALEGEEGSWGTTADLYLTTVVMHLQMLGL